MTEFDVSKCPGYNRAVEIIGRRWAGAVIRAMLGGATRFGEIRDAADGITDRMLSQRLKDLEAEGVLLRTVQPETPVRIEYHLTDKGRDLADVVGAISQWADQWQVARQQEVRN